MRDRYRPMNEIIDRVQRKRDAREILREREDKRSEEEKKAVKKIIAQLETAHECLHMIRGNRSGMPEHQEFSSVLSASMHALSAAEFCVRQYQDQRWDHSR
jgi:hypothetical protein